MVSNHLAVATNLISPWSASGKHGICEEKQLSGASDESELMRLSGGGKSAVESNQLAFQRKAAGKAAA